MNKIVGMFFSHFPKIRKGFHVNQSLKNSGLHSSSQKILRNILLSNICPLDKHQICPWTNTSINIISSATYLGFSTVSFISHSLQ